MTPAPRALAGAAARRPVSSNWRSPSLPVPLCRRMLHCLALAGGVSSSGTRWRHFGRSCRRSQRRPSRTRGSAPEPPRSCSLARPPSDAQRRWCRCTRRAVHDACASVHLHARAPFRFAALAPRLQPAQAMGIPVECLAVADKKVCSTDFIRYHHPEVQHIYGHVASLHAPEPPQCWSCAQQQTSCKRREDGGPPPMVVVAGLPCQPYSPARQKGGKSTATGVATTHPLFGVAFQDFAKYLEDREAGGFIVEEVEAFGWESNASPGESHLNSFMAMMAGIGFSTAVVHLHASVWCEISRSRPPRAPAGAGAGEPRGTF